VYIMQSDHCYYDVKCATVNSAGTTDRNETLNDVTDGDYYHWRCWLCGMCGIVIIMCHRRLPISLFSSKPHKSDRFVVSRKSSLAIDVVLHRAHTSAYRPITLSLT